MSTRSTRHARSYFIATVIAVLALSGCAAREKLAPPAPIDLPAIDVPEIDVPDVAVHEPMDLGIADTNSTSRR